MNNVNDLRNSMPFGFLSIAIVCLLLMTLAARPTNSAAYSAQVSPTDEAREAMMKARRALRAVKSLRIRLESYCSDQPPTVILEEVYLDRNRTIEKDSETIIIGKELYRREGNGPWKQLPDRYEERTSDVTRFPESIGTKRLESNEEIKFIGPDTLDNVPVLVYQYTRRDASGNRVLLANKDWIGAQDGLLHRAELTVAALGESAAPPCKMITTYYDFNAEIVIEPPLVPPTLLTTETGAQPIDEKQRQAVQQAAEAWLKLMDERKTSDGWEATAQCLKAKFRKTEWEAQLRFLLSELGKERWTIKSRKLKKAAFVKSLPSVHDQEGIVLEYEGALERYGPVSERVELVLEPDQVWRVAAYKASGGLISLMISPSSIYLDSCTGCGPGTGVGPGTNTGGGNPNALTTMVDQKPVALNSPSPRYTEAARRNRVEGTVRVRVLISPDGTIKQVRMLRGLPDGLEEEAIRAAYQLRFRPAMKDGKPVAFWQPVDIEFHLGYRQ